MKFRGEIWRDDMQVEYVDFEGESKEQAIEFMEKVRTDVKRGKVKGIGVVVRRIYWKIPWFAFYVSMKGREMK